ncbi:uncharacterized protein PV09_01046 [Verruconis gallopava]|uniref:Chromosome segregation in meiosis protein n=1 Tax=Verruconis gallopava TaxID=253628 RepID=A0A0D2BA18_9PEZI|nr:uncharacterized protein PV09_01046 [Verruconis gallopava]KIW08109.1 hypothetical protein PV09_01046 [Verruconis gallopava]
MARPDAESRPQDDLDALFEADHTMDDIFTNIRRENPKAQNETSEAQEVTYRRRTAGEQNDVDDSIKITKKRKPIAKLDDKRLLSDAGIPKLQKIAKDRFKFKGKGHEFSDVAKLLRTYQLWLDDLYPRAKFADGLSIIEKLGHSNRMRLQRKAWIEEGRPKESTSEDIDLEGEKDGSQRPGSVNGGDIVRERSASTAWAETETPSNAANSRMADNGTGISEISGQKTPHEPNEDELDALLAEESLAKGSSNNLPKGAIPEQLSQRQEQSFEDEEEAMREMGWY